LILWLWIEFPPKNAYLWINSNWSIFLCISLISIAGHTLQKQNYAQSSPNPPESNWCSVSKAGMSLMRSATNAWCSQSSRVKLPLVFLHQLRFTHTNLLLFKCSPCSMPLNVWRGIKCSINLVGLNYLQRMHTYESILTEASFCISFISIANHTIQKQNYAQRSSQNPPESNWCPVSKAGMSLMRSATNAWCSQSSRVKLRFVVLHQLRFIHTTLLLFTYSSCSMSLNIWRGIKCSINMIRCPLRTLVGHSHSALLPSIRM
jgi:hypothetical protein